VSQPHSLRPVTHLREVINTVQISYVRTSEELQALCERLDRFEHIFYDTEFISEDVYLPDLCLIQVASREEVAVIDPKPNLDLTPFWKLLTDPKHIVVAHAAREEFLFCLRSTGNRLSRLFDTQIAAGMVGLEYPASFGNLILKLLNEKLPKGETRTNWRERPLTQRQLEYARNDVIYLIPLYDALHAQMTKLDRYSWLDEEMEKWQEGLERYSTRPAWRSVSGIGNLSRRSLAIVRELWTWRDQRAQRQNSPPRRILRDDLMVELARRRSDKVVHIRALRGMNRRDLEPLMDDIAEAVRVAMELPEEDCPEISRNNSQQQYVVLGQFLTAALGSICREARVAPSLASTVQDVRDLVAYHLDGADQPPLLARGWRAEVVGRTIEQLLDGTLVVRIGNPRAIEPLDFEQGRPVSDT